MGLKTRLIPVLAVFCTVIAACTSASAEANSSNSATTTTTPSGPVIVKSGGTVTVAVPYLPSEFNPSTPSGENTVTDMVMEQVWPQPFVINGGLQATLALDSHAQPGLLGPSGAELESVHPETIVYNINPGAKWSDGVPITVADFIYNWHEQLAEGAMLPATDPLLGYEDIKSITGSSNGKVVTVVFSKPYADWEALFANLVPAHVAQRYGWASAFASFDPTKVISGGPFEITKVVRGKELVLTRNPHYWGNPPLLRRIIFEVVPSTKVIDGLTSGRIDVAELAPGEGTSALSADTSLSVQPSLSPVLWQLVFNVASPDLRSVNVREGVANAIDREQLVTNTVGFLTPFGTTAGNRVYGSGAPGSQGNDSVYSQVDLTEADQLFADVGYVLGSDGRLRLPSGEPLVFNLVGPTGSPTVVEVEAELQAQLLQAGIELHVQNVAPSELLGSILPSGRYQLALAPFAVSAFPSTTTVLYSDPVGPTPDSVSFVPVDTTGTTGDIAAPSEADTRVAGASEEPDAVAFGAVTRDVFGFDDPAVSALYAQASSELNASSASGIYNQIDATLWQDMPTLPLFQMPSILVTRADLVNVSNTQTPMGPLWDAQDWAIQLSPPPTTTTTTP